MINKRIPTPNPSDSWQSWAVKLVNSLRFDEHVAGITLPHKVPGDNSSAKEPGVLMFDRATNAPVYSTGTEWVPFTGGGGTGGTVHWDDIEGKPLFPSLTQAVYSNRAVASAAFIPPEVTYINVGGLDYIEDAEGTALTTLGGRFWSPANVVSPLHWGAVGDGVANDREAVQASIDYFVKTEDSKPTAYIESPAGVWDGMGRQYAVDGPVYIGNVGAGEGMMYHTSFHNMKLVALPGDWSGEIVVGVPKQLLVVAWRMQEDYSDQGAGIFNNMFSKVLLDCNYLTGGIYLENTNSCTISNCRIARVGKDRIGYDTGQFRTNGASHPHGYRIGNGALMVENLIIGALEEEVDAEYPPGEDKDSMNTIGMRHRTNDARLNNIIINGPTVAAEFQDSGAVQIHNFHPWSKRVILGDNTANYMFSNCYFDFTRLQIFGEFNHYFIGCHWILGSAATLDNGLELIATKANSDAKGLILSGCRFRSDISIKFLTSGGSWVADRNRKYVLSGCTFEDSVPNYVERLGDGALLVRSNGLVELTYVPSYLSQSAATGAGLTTGQIYRDGSGTLKIVT